MGKAEDYARELKQNIGLFVHADNESAIALYKKTGYHTKVVPISKRLIGPAEVTPVNGLRVDQVSNPESTVRDMEYRNFKDKVLFSTDVEDKMIVARFERYLENSARTDGKKSRFVAYSDAGMCVGSVLIGTSGFDEKVAMVYVIAVTTEEKQQVGNILIKSAEKWAVEQGFGTIYILLHSEDDLDLEFFKEREYKVPGYFMEFRVI
jgi:N-acetylglutamate synthase-like GNAT family acetyltransferase